MDSSRKNPVLQSEYKDGKRERRRLEILDAAATVFARHGYFAATMQDIADLLGMRSASLYYYFDSKEAALEEVCRRGGREFVRQLSDLMKSDRPVIEIIEAGIQNHLESKWRDHVTSFVFNRQNLPDRVLEEMNGIARDYAALWNKILQRGQKSGEIAPGIDTRTAAAAILAICNSLATTDPSGRRRTNTATETALTLVLDGIRRRDS